MQANQQAEESFLNFMGSDVSAAFSIVSLVVLLAGVMSCGDAHAASSLPRPSPPASRLARRSGALPRRRHGRRGRRRPVRRVPAGPRGRARRGGNRGHGRRRAGPAPRGRVRDVPGAVPALSPGRGRGGGLRAGRGGAGDGLPRRVVLRVAGGSCGRARGSARGGVLVMTRVVGSIVETDTNLALGPLTAAGSLWSTAVYLQESVQMRKIGFWVMLEVGGNCVYGNTAS